MEVAASNVLNKFVDYVINPAILLVFAAGFFLFIWGLVVFLWEIRDGGDKSRGKEHMKWGLVGMFVMVSVYGIISLIDQTFELNIANPDVSRIQNVTAPANFFSN